MKKYYEPFISLPLTLLWAYLSVIQPYFIVSLISLILMTVWLIREGNANWEKYGSFDL